MFWKVEPEGVMDHPYGQINLLGDAPASTAILKSKNSPHMCNEDKYLVYCGY